ncbi:Sugar phosphate permease [Sphingobium faniae]|nr:Sugar phosphate permease [Sphingobium faniae]
MASAWQRLGTYAAGARTRILLSCFLAQSVAIGVAYGTFGPLLQVNVDHFGVSRAWMSVGMSILSATMGVIAPLLGAMMPRLSVRGTMMIAAFVGFLGYIGLAVTNSFYLALFMYFLTGASMTALAILCPVVLINRWFSENRGKALAMANLPIALAFAPYIIVALLPIYGRFWVIAGLGIIHLLLIPIFLLIVDQPRQAEATADAAPDAKAKTAPAAAPDNAGILKSPAFWCVSVGAALMAAAGSAFFVHIISFGVEHGMTPQAASGLLAIYAAAGVAGTPLFGWLADRIGAILAFAIAGVVQALMWWAMVYTSGVALYGVILLLGMCILPLVTLIGASLGEIFGKESVGLAMGYCYTIKLPFLFVYPPLVGLIADKTGNYAAAFLMTGGILALSALGLFAAMHMQRGIRSSTKVKQIAEA